MKTNRTPTLNKLANLSLETMKGKKNDYSMTFYNGEEKRLFLEYVHDTNKAFSWVDSKNIEWTHANLYERRTRIFLGRFYANNTER